MKPITELAPGDLFTPDYDPTNVYTFCRYGQDSCTVRRVAFLMEETWYLAAKAQEENYNSYAKVMPVTMRFKRGNM